MNDLSLVEFLRFGSSIPGNYWGCCAGDIIQCFKSAPDALATCQSVNGDGGYPQKNAQGEDLFFGITNEELFRSRLRVGTFGSGDMKDHFFFLVLEDSQLNGTYGKAWLPILKDCGFVFLMTLNNSVWTKTNHIFMLVRNITGVIKDPFTPPKAWTDLPSNGKTEFWQLIQHTDEGEDFNTKTLAKQWAEVDQKVWDNLGPAKMYTRKQIEAMNEERAKNNQPLIPIVLAGLRSENPQELAKTREDRQAKSGKKQEQSLRGGAAPIA